MPEHVQAGSDWPLKSAMKFNASASEQFTILESKSLRKKH